MNQGWLHSLEARDLGKGLPEKEERRRSNNIGGDLEKHAGAASAIRKKNQEVIRNEKATRRIKKREGEGKYPSVV